MEFWTWVDFGSLAHWVVRGRLGVYLVCKCSLLNHPFCNTSMCRGVVYFMYFMHSMYKIYVSQGSMPCCLQLFIGSSRDSFMHHASTRFSHLHASLFILPTLPSLSLPFQVLHRRSGATHLPKASPQPILNRYYGSHLELELFIHLLSSPPPFFFLLQLLICFFSRRSILHRKFEDRTSRSCMCFRSLI